MWIDLGSGPVQPACLTNLPLDSPIRAFTALRSGRVRDVLAITLVRPVCRAPCIHDHLGCLVTSPGEKAGQ